MDAEAESILLEMAFDVTQFQAFYVHDDEDLLWGGSIWTTEAIDCINEALVELHSPAEGDKKRDDDNYDDRSCREEMVWELRKRTSVAVDDL